uniref:Fibrinogen C-terminal domain-containing protein n=1 Tax=Clytia hemisphaerica TaxID=252671 RepID=A0A7M5VB31_9CNID
MNLFVIVLFSFTLALHLFILEATHYSIIALLGRPTSWEAEYRLEVDYDTCCQEMCRANESCKSYDQIWQPSRDIYECRFYSKNYQVLKAEGEKLELIPRVQYYSKMHKMTNCSDWFHKGGARESIPYKMVDGILEDCDYSFSSCDEVVNKGLLEDRIEAVFPIFVSAVNEINNIRCRKYHDKGWVVFQKRVEPAKFPFNKKSWQEYKEGFEESEDDFWLGNELLHQWTKHKENELLVLLEFDEYGWHGKNIGSEFRTPCLEVLGIRTQSIAVQVCDRNLHTTNRHICSVFIYFHHQPKAGTDSTLVRKTNTINCTSAIQRASM